MDSSFIVLALTSLLLIDLSCSTGDYYHYRKEFYPNPRIDPIVCGSKSNEPSYLCDPDGVLADFRGGTVEDTLTAFPNATDCSCTSCQPRQPGIKIAVAIAKTIYFPFQSNREEVAIEFADYLRRQWSIGVCNDDIVIFVVTEDKLIHTSLGYNAKRFLSNEAAVGINQEVKKQLTSDTSQAIITIVNKYRTEIEEAQERARQRPDEDKEVELGTIGAIVGSVVAAILILILIVVFVRSKRMGRTVLREKRASGAVKPLKQKPRTSHTYEQVPGKEPSYVADTKIPMGEIDDDKVDPTAKDDNEKKDDKPEKVDKDDKTEKVSKDDKPEKNNKDDGKEVDKPPPPVAPRPKTPPTNKNNMDSEV